MTPITCLVQGWEDAPILVMHFEFMLQWRLSGVPYPFSSLGPNLQGTVLAWPSTMEKFDPFVHTYVDRTYRCTARCRSHHGGLKPTNDFPRPRRPRGAMSASLVEWYHCDSLASISHQLRRRQLRDRQKTTEVVSMNVA